MNPVQNKIPKSHKAYTGRFSDIPRSWTVLTLMQASIYLEPELEQGSEGEKCVLQHSMNLTLIVLSKLFRP